MYWRYFIFALVIILSITIGYNYKSSHIPVSSLRCEGDVIITKKFSNNDIVTLNSRYHYIFNKKSGTLNIYGTIFDGHINYIVDREITFNYRGSENKGVYIFKYITSKQKGLDNVPVELFRLYFEVGSASPNIYITLSSLDNNILVINQISRNPIMCLTD